MDTLEATVMQETEGGHQKQWTPAEWVTALAGALASKAATLTLIQLQGRSGRRGAWMLIQAETATTLVEAGDAAEATRLAADFWQQALSHRAGIGGKRWDYRLVGTGTATEDGAPVTVFETEPVELGEGEGSAPLAAGFEAGGAQGLLVMMCSRLFDNNLRMGNAMAGLVEKVGNAGNLQFDNNAKALHAMKESALAIVETERARNEPEMEAREMEEMGKVAMHWMSLAHQEKLSKQGIDVPHVPTTKRECAMALRQSLTINQLDKLLEVLGEETAQALSTFLENAKNLDDEGIAFAIEAVKQAGPDGQPIDLMAVATQVFAPPLVPGPWAAFQIGCLKAMMM